MKTFLIVITLFSLSNCRQVNSVQTEYNRIVSLAPSLTEMVYALGQGERIVAVTQFDNYPEQVKKLPKVGGFITPNLEAIVFAKPDLVITTPNSGGPAQLQALKKFNIPVLTFPTQKFSDLPLTLKKLAQVLGCPQQEKEILTSITNQLSELQHSFESPKPPKAIVALGLKPLVVAGPTSFIGSLLSKIGIVNVVAAGGDYPIWDLEKLVAAQPDILINLTMHDSSQNHDYLASLMQSVSHPIKIVSYNNDAILRLGPRLPKALANLAQLVHGTTTHATLK